MTRTLAITLLWSAISLAQTGLAPPHLGCLVAEGGSLRPVLGVPGNFVLGEVVEWGVVSAACGKGFALIKREDALELVDEESGLIRRWSAPGGPALFALSREGQPALVYFPQTSQWFRVADQGLRNVELEWPERNIEVLAIAQPGRDRLAAVVRRESSLRLLKLSLESLRIEEESELAGATAPVLLGPDGALLLAADDGLAVRMPGGGDRWVALPGRAAGLAQIGEGWIEVRLAEGKGRWGLRLLKDGEELYQLPEAPR